MKHLALILHFSLLLIPCFASVPLKWHVETSRVQPATFDAFQGETLDFEAALQSYGKPLAAPPEYAFYWQTNGMGSAWWSRPCRNGEAVSSPLHTNVLFATWTPDMDVGAKAYTCFIGQTGTVYHAAFQLRLRPSPGATPNELPLPTPVIDFAKVTVLNPPWSGGGGVDTNTVREIVGPMIEGHHDGTKLDARSVHWEGKNLVFGEGDVYHDISMHTGVIKEVGRLELEIQTAISYLDAETGEQVVFDLSNVAKRTELEERLETKGVITWIGDRNTYLDVAATLGADRLEVYDFERIAASGMTLNDYLASGEWNTATDPFAKMSDIPEAYVPSASDPAFSNAVLAVGIDTNALTQIGEMYALFEGLPVDPVTGGVSVGALLAALAAAVAWLKKNAVTNGKKDDGSPADPKLADFFGESDTLLAATIDARLPYQINTAGTILDRNVNVVKSGAFVIPEGFKDLLIRYTGTPTSLTFSGSDTTITNWGDGLPTEPGDYLITVTRIAAAECYIRIIELKERA